MKKSGMRLHILFLVFIIFLQFSAYGSLDGREKPKALNGTDKATESVNIDSQEITERSQEIKTSLEMMLIGCFLVMGIYNLILFFFFRKEAPYANLGALCILACVWTAAASRMYIMPFLSGSDSELLKKVEFIAYALCIPLYVTYVRSLFAEDFKMAVIKVIWAAGIISCALLLFTPYLENIRILKFYDLLSFAICIYTFIMLVGTSMKKRNGSYVMLAGTVVVSFGVFGDILSRQGVISTGGMGSYGLMIFLLLQIYIISSRFINSYRKEVTSRHSLMRKSFELEKSKNLLKCILDSLSSPLISVDDNIIISEINVLARKCLPEEKVEIAGKRLWEIIPVREEYKGTLEEVIKTSNPANISSKRVIKDDKRLFNISISPLVDSSCTGAVILADDVTEINRKEEQIKQSQKMETIGIIAGGLVHDFNNALGGILSTATLMKHCITEGIESGRVSERISMIETAAKNAAGLVGRFLNLTKKHDVVYVPVDLNNTVQHVAKICRDTFDKTIEIHTGYLLEEAFILADELQIEHLLLNLCINASQAMTMMRGREENPGGVLDISMGSIDAADDLFRRHKEIKPQDFWTVSVSDTGVGMDSDTLSKIFEPFFSTKGTGTGLGLMMAESIVKQHEGFIDVRSIKGKGSLFMVCFKKYTGAVSEPVLAKTSVKHKAEGEGIILLAEDDEIIREMAKEHLEENGYKVIEAKNGEEALSIFRQKYSEISGVFMDTAMPVMSGRDAFLAMKEIDPEVKVLLTSGFAHDPAVKDAISQGVNAFLNKPYSMPALLAKIREVFD